MTKNKPTVALIVPTYQAANDLPYLIPAILKQTHQPDHILFIDSSSNDDTHFLLKKYSLTCHIIPKHEFNHGGTRKLGTELIDADIYLFLTQDAYPADEYAFQYLIETLLTDDNIGCAYGRQLPKSDATLLSAHARLFNYPNMKSIKSQADIPRYGIKTCFNSNSFAAYKKNALIQIGNFPTSIILGEDVYVAAKLILAGFKTAYTPHACVYHSHNFTLSQEFQRYFSIGVFHGTEKWMMENFNSASGEGLRFVLSELKFLISNRKMHYIPRALLSTIIKYIAYHLGKYRCHRPISF